MNEYIQVLKKYSVFNGRAGRREYWMFFLISVVISILLPIVLPSGIDVVVQSLYALATLLPSISVGVRRLHDTEHSGGWMFIGLIPIVGTIILIVFLATKGQLTENRYGPALG
ncbi:MAG: DUF805 domain-containing protein [Candidatus Brennerbacteria bacterium]